MPDMLKLNQPSVVRARNDPLAERRVAGTPRRPTWAQYTHKSHKSGKVEGGSREHAPDVWRTAPSTYKKAWFSVVAGRLSLTTADGACCEFGPRDTGVIPAGLHNLFKDVGPVCEHEAVFDKAPWPVLFPRFHQKLSSDPTGDNNADPVIPA